MKGYLVQRDGPPGDGSSGPQVPTEGVRAGESCWLSEAVVSFIEEPKAKGTHQRLVGLFGCWVVEVIVLFL